MEFIPGRMYERIGESNSFLTKGKIYKALSSDKVCTPDGAEYHAMPERFRLIEEEPTVSKRLHGMDYSALEARVLAHVTKKEDNTYTFKVSSEDAIDYQEIMETLTRKRPVAIVKRSDGMHTVIIHDSLWNKVALVDPALNDKIFEAMDIYWSAGGYIPLSSKHLPKVLSLLKELRTAPYVNRKKLTVSVETLEI